MSATKTEAKTAECGWCGVKVGNVKPARCGSCRKVLCSAYLRDCIASHVCRRA